ncbi:MAG: hypothetical protein ABIK28_08360 [Planctomycetota bacterium]
MEKKQESKKGLKSREKEKKPAQPVPDLTRELSSLNKLFPCWIYLLSALSMKTNIFSTFGENSLADEAKNTSEINSLPLDARSPAKTAISYLIFFALKDVLTLDSPKTDC